MISRFPTPPAGITSLSFGAAAIFVALLLAAAVAYGDPSFLLTESKAEAGEGVHFSIYGTEEDATYALEVGGTEVAQGSDPDGNGVSGAFTMPDLGDTTRTVSVEAQITQSDETTTVTHALLYVAPAQAVTAPSEAQPGAPATETQRDITPVRTHPAPAQEPTLQPAAGVRPPPRAQRRRRPPSRRARGRRRAGPKPPRIREWHPRKRLRVTRAAGPGRSRGSLVAALATGPSNPPAGPASGANLTSTAGSADHTPARADSGGARSTIPPTSLLTVPPSAPAIFSLAAGVANDDSPGVPILAVLVAMLLGIAALVFAGVSPIRMWRPATVQGWALDDDDDEVLHGLVHVPRSQARSAKALLSTDTASQPRSPFTAPEARKRRAPFRSSGSDEEDDEALQGSKHVAGPRRPPKGRRPLRR